MKKIISVILLLSFVLCLFACKETDTVTETETETEEESYVPVDISGIVSPLSINGEEVPYSLYRYYFAAVRFRYDSDDQSFWEDNDYTDKIRDEVMRYIRRSVELTESEKRQVEQKIMSDRLQYADDGEYYRSLDGNYLTEDTYRFLEELASLEDKLLSYLISDESGPK